jgi:hypothetical protein
MVRKRLRPGGSRVSRTPIRRHGSQASGRSAPAPRSAQYVDDLTLPGLVAAHVLRSPHAHARVVAIDTAAAEKLPGVWAVLTARDLEGAVNPKPLILAPPNTKNPWRLALAADRVRFVGDPVAFVVAADRATARDAADAIQVEYEPLTPVLDPEAALAPAALQLHAEAAGNLAYTHAWSAGDVDARPPGRPSRRELPRDQSTLVGAADGDPRLPRPLAGRSAHLLDLHRGRAQDQVAPGRNPRGVRARRARHRPKWAEASASSSACSTRRC